TVLDTQSDGSIPVYGTGTIETPPEWAFCLLSDTVWVRGPSGETLASNSGSAGGYVSVDAFYYVTDNSPLGNYQSHTEGYNNGTNPPQGPWIANSAQALATDVTLYAKNGYQQGNWCIWPTKNCTSGTPSCPGNTINFPTWGCWPCIEKI